MIKCKREAQSTMEYAILIAIVAAALVAMQVYLKRGVQGKIKDLAEQISPQQYEAGGTVSEYTVVQHGEVNRSFVGSQAAKQASGKEQGTTRTSQSENVTRNGYEEVVQTEN